MNTIAKIKLDKMDTSTPETLISALLDQMTLAEKIGQMQQVDAGGTGISEDLASDIREGRIGSVINQSDPEISRRLQLIAVKESRLGIPLLVGRDVIHGLKTVFPIPLGQAASWNPDIVRKAARFSAQEADAAGINWTFAPMIDISRDPRWGRIAESFGEDPFLTGALGVAMTEGLQGHDMSEPGCIAACAKHFAGYGASEGGRDYSASNIPENELRNIYLPPFKAVADAGIATFMSSFSDIDGIPATANRFLMKDVLRDEWGFDGLVVSDWDAVRELSVHGLTENDYEAAFEAASAGIDMEMSGGAYRNHLTELVEQGKVEIDEIDQMVANILRLKLRLGLFNTNFEDDTPIPVNQALGLEIARTAAIESAVLLRNENQTLPLCADRLKSIAVIGPLADSKAEQLGTWVFDGAPDRSVTPLQAITDFAGTQLEIRFAPALASTIDRQTNQFDEAIDMATSSDVAVIFAGEDAILSGEAHSRADINLPGAQIDLIKRIKATGTPVVLVLMAGRPLTLEDIVSETDAILFAWHPGSLAGPALCDLLFGVASPSGKLPVTFPKAVGQIPIYYNHKKTGRPPSANSVVHIDDIEVGAAQTSLGMTAFYLDAGYKPAFPFGFGLSYAEFEYSEPSLSAESIEMGGTLRAEARVTNRGSVAAAEIVQLYVRDLAASLTRPVRELKGFEKIWLEPGETRAVGFELSTQDLAFFRRDKTFGAEPGEFHLWIAGSSDRGMKVAFSISS